jgi:hypothetical protein
MAMIELMKSNPIGSNGCLPTTPCCFKDTTSAGGSPLNDESVPEPMSAFACNLPLFKSGQIRHGGRLAELFNVIPEAVELRRDFNDLATHRIPLRPFTWATCSGRPATTGLRYCNNGVASIHSRRRKTSGLRT